MHHTRHYSHRRPGLRWFDIPKQGLDFWLICDTRPGVVSQPEPTPSGMLPQVERKYLVRAPPLQLLR